MVVDYMSGSSRRNWGSQGAIQTMGEGMVLLDNFGENPWKTTVFHWLIIIFSLIIVASACIHHVHFQTKPPWICLCNIVCLFIFYLWERNESVLGMCDNVWLTWQTQKIHDRLDVWHSVDPSSQPENKRWHGSNQHEQQANPMKSPFFMVKSPCLSIFHG